MVILLVIAGCAGLGLGLDETRVRSAYDKGRAQFDAKAQSGEISWVQAATRTRELDKAFARRTDLDSNWKYDRDDEEYHSYCIAIAERLDKKQISFAQYDAARNARLNQISARRQFIQNSQPRQQNCVTEKVGAPPFETYQTRCL